MGAGGIGVDRSERGGGGAGGSADAGSRVEVFGRASAPPQFWYDAENVDGMENATLADGQGVGVWVNLGSFGSAGNLAQGVLASRPLFHRVATPGYIGGKSAIEGDGSRWLASQPFALQAQPYLAVMVYRMTDLAAPYVLCAGAVDGAQYEMYLPTGGAISVVAGGPFTATMQQALAATWETSLTMLVGPSSWHRLNGAQSATLSLGGAGFSGVTLFGENHGFRARVMIAEHLRWVGELPDPVDVEAYLSARRGRTPQ